MIGIFGDSFADTNTKYASGTGIGWPLLLNEEIENFVHKYKNFIRN